MFLAEIDTGRFRFSTLAENQQDAAALLLTAWEEHCEQYEGADPALMEQAILDGDVNYCRIRVGVALRDGETIYPRGGAR